MFKLLRLLHVCHAFGLHLVKKENMKQNLKKIWLYKFNRVKIMNNLSSTFVKYVGPWPMIVGRRSL